MCKKIVKLFGVFAIVFAMVMGSITSMAADVSEVGIDVSLLDTELHPNATGDVETRKERHERLIAEGYVLEDIQIVNKSRNLYITGSDGNLYETRVSRSTYTQPNKTTVKYGEDYLNVITQSTVNNLILTAVGFVKNVGWIPTALGIDTNSLADFLSRGRVTHICDSTLFYYEIEVRPSGTDKFYFVASSERFEMAVTAVSSGFSSSGSPVQKTVSGSAASQSDNYENESALSAIAVDYFVTGGPDNTYIYTEQYDEIERIDLN